jgi:hypothetical protein
MADLIVYNLEHPDEGEGKKKQIQEPTYQQTNRTCSACGWPLHKVLTKAGIKFLCTNVRCLFRNNTQ